MSNISDNLPACYACAVIFICRFAEGFVLPFQEVSFYTLFYFTIFSLIIILTFTLPLFRSSFYLIGHCFMFFYVLLLFLWK